MKAKIIGPLLFLLALSALLSTHFIRPHFISYAGGMPYMKDDGGKFYVRIALTAVLTCAALYVILATGRLKYGPGEKHWAYGTLGLIVGFWLKGDELPIPN